MANMSYCMWENTAEDMRQLRNALANGESDFDTLSREEKGGYKEVAGLAAQLLIGIIDAGHEEVMRNSMDWFEELKDALENYID